MYNDEVLKISLSKLIPLLSSLFLFSFILTITITIIESIAVIPIWSRKGSVGKKPPIEDPESHPLGPTLKNKAIGIDASAPYIAPLFEAFFQNKPKTNTDNIPGLTTPVFGLNPYVPG